VRIRPRMRMVMMSLFPVFEKILDAQF